jgi:serine O-acetyltransferase
MCNIEVAMVNRSAEIWERIRKEGADMAAREPMLASFLHATILNHSDLGSALVFVLANKLGGPVISPMNLRDIFEFAYQGSNELVDAACMDIEAVVSRDPAIQLYSTPLLYLKGFHAIEAYRVAHRLWQLDRRELALFLQSQISEVFNVDIHPAAVLGHGLMFDHASGIVIGETSVVGDNVSILHNVTLGGTGKEVCDRHPKIASDVMIGAGAKILGNIHIGQGVKIGAGSVVLEDVPPHVTVVGVPARIVGLCSDDHPAFDMDQRI